MKCHALGPFITCDVYQAEATGAGPSSINTSPHRLSQQVMLLKTKVKEILSVAVCELSQLGTKVALLSSQFGTGYLALLCKRIAP